MAKKENPMGGRSRPAISPEERENQLIALTYDLVEARIRDGSATSQETTHFLKMGSARYKLEQRKLESEAALLESKKDQIISSEESAQKHQEVLDALKLYSGEY